MLHVFPYKYKSNIKSDYVDVLKVQLIVHS